MMGTYRSMVTVAPNSSALLYCDSFCPEDLQFATSHVNWNSLTSNLPQGAQTLKSEGSSEFNPHMTYIANPILNADLHRSAVLVCCRQTYCILLFVPTHRRTSPDSDSPPKHLQTTWKDAQITKHPGLFLDKKWGGGGGGTLLSAQSLQIL